MSLRAPRSSSPVRVTYVDSDTARASMTDVLGVIGPRFWIVAALAAVAGAAVMGVPTDVVPTPLFQRMTPVRPQDYIFLAVTSLLLGALLATYAGVRVGTRSAGAGAGAGAGLLGSLAIGCPVCNKIIVSLLGVSGAVQYFGPVQPLVGAGGVALAAAALIARLRALSRGCATSPAETG